MGTKITTSSGPEVAQTLHEMGGLAVTLAVGLRKGAKRYVVTHVSSGCAVGERVLGISRVTRDFSRAEDARAALEAILHLTDWRRPGEDVACFALEATRIMAALCNDAATLSVLPPTTI